MEFEISDTEMFLLIGQKEVELYIKEKMLEKYRTQIDKTKEYIAGVESLKMSNKSLAETNIELDKALTEARKERDEYSKELKRIKEEKNKLLKELEQLKKQVEDKNKKKE